jgi:hypothetical protein
LTESIETQGGTGPQAPEHDSIFTLKQRIEKLNNMELVLDYEDKLPPTKDKASLE